MEKVFVYLISVTNYHTPITGLGRPILQKGVIMGVVHLHIYPEHA